MQVWCLVFILFSIVHQILLSQTKDANTQTKPLTLGRQWQQDYVQTGREMKAQTKEINCTTESAYIREVISVCDTTRDNETKLFKNPIIAIGIGTG